MARPREFDEDEVLEKAMEAFWSRGYEATSVADLMDATGLAKGSVYKAFGDKHRLFLLALDRYLDRGIRALREAAARERPAREMLRGWLDGVVEMATRPGPRQGCFMVHASVERAAHDPDVAARVADHQARQERVFAGVVARGVEAGELRPDLDPATTARLITTLVHGLQVAGRTRLTRATGRRVVDAFLDGLEAPPG